MHLNQCQCFSLNHFQIYGLYECVNSNSEKERIIMVLVTAANGRVARRVIPELVKKGIEVKAIDITPEAESLKDLGVKDVFIGDASKADMLKKAFKNCDQLLYIPPGGIYTETKLANLAIDVAAELKIRQIVLMTVTHPNMSTLLQHTQKLKAEEHLIYKGLSHNLNYTILQPMHYTHNFPIKQVWDTNVYNCTYTLTTKLSYVDTSDVGEVAAKILTEDGHQNATYELVGTDFLSPNDLVAIFNEVAGRNATAKLINVEDIIDSGLIKDTHLQEAMRQVSDTYSRYGIAGNANVLTWLLGRKPTTFGGYVKKELERFL